MSVQQRNIIKLSGITKMNSRTSLYISGIFMLSCIFLLTVENVTNSGFEEIVYQARMYSVGGIKSVFSGKLTTRAGEFTK